MRVGTLGRLCCAQGLYVRIAVVAVCCGHDVVGLAGVLVVLGAEPLCGFPMYQRRAVGTGVEHLIKNVMYCSGEGECPGALDGGSVDGVLAPVGAVFRASCSLRAVGAGRDSDEVLGVIKVVGVLPPLLSVPSPSAADVSVSERHHVVDVQLAGVGDNGAGVLPQPFAGGNATPPVGSV